MTSFVRVGLLAVAAFVSLASSSNRSSTTSTSTYPQQGRWDPPPNSTPGVYWCHTLRSGEYTGSLCFPEFDRCERERQTENAEGMYTMYCQQASPVACFQLGGDPNPSQEMCGQTLEDCELWRTIDQDKNGGTGEPCAWKH
jgi:hypothetical protein